MKSYFHLPTIYRPYVPSDFGHHRRSGLQSGTQQPIFRPDCPVDRCRLLPSLSQATLTLSRAGGLLRAELMTLLEERAAGAR
jgi:hypothetical protein